MIYGIAEEVLKYAYKRGVKFTKNKKTNLPYCAVIAVWGSADGGMVEAVRRASDGGMPLVIIDAETLSVTSFGI